MNGMDGMDEFGQCNMHGCIECRTEVDLEHELSCRRQGHTIFEASTLLLDNASSNRRMLNLPSIMVQNAP
jgi:hypothetical protein